MAESKELKEMAWEIARELLGNHYFVTMNDNEEMYYYELGIYRPHAETFIKQLVQKFYAGEDLITNHLVSEVLGHISRSTLKSREIFQESNPHLVLEDCLFNLQTKEKEEFSPEKYYLSKMKVRYDPSIGYHNSKFWKFINEVLSPQDVDGIQEELGAILRQKYLTKKLSIWEGETDTGKTTLVNIFIALLGTESVSSVPLKELSENNRFSIGRLFGKMLNIVDDMPRDVIHSVGKMKELTGGGQVKGEGKFKDLFDFTNKAFLISTVNKLPLIEEDDDAFWNRVILRAFRNRFGGHDKPDRQLLDKLTTPEELSAILNFGLKGLESLERNGYNFSNTQSIEDIREEYKKRSDPIWAFATYRLDNSDSEAYEPKEELYNVFKSYCEKENLANPGKDYFYKHLPDKVTVTSGRRGEKGSQKHCFIGIKLKQSGVLSGE